jgi:hypothetical protein
LIHKTNVIGRIVNPFEEWWYFWFDGFPSFINNFTT